MIVFSPHFDSDLTVALVKEGLKKKTFGIRRLQNTIVYRMNAKLLAVYCLTHAFHYTVLFPIRRIDILNVSPRGVFFSFSVIWLFLSFVLFIRLLLSRKVRKKRL